MNSNLSTTPFAPSFGARVLINVNRRNERTPISDTNVSRLIDEGELIANEYSYMKLDVAPMQNKKVSQITNDVLIMKDGSHKIMKQSEEVKDRNIMQCIRRMYSEVDKNFKKLPSVK